MIQVPHGESFDVDDLIDHIRKSGRNYIIQGQQNCILEDHTKPSSLDYWLRSREEKNKNIKQAENSVLDSLAATGRLKIFKKLPCPDSGRACKGIVLVEALLQGEGP